MPTLQIDNSIDMLRGRFMRCRRALTVPEVAVSLNVHPNTLYRFLKGGQDTTVEIMRIIERWCERQETQEGAHGPATPAAS